jgi:L-ascorbate metabolism protein UlaG (beta-lactamase superfamily)
MANVCGQVREFGKESRAKIRWYGHACSRIEGEGIAVVTDPYTPEAVGV